MEELLEGIRIFSKKSKTEDRELYEQLKHKQDPHTLFIGCSDSRLTPEKMLNVKPGEIFVIRNVGNIVPHYKNADKNHSVASALEYAVQVLQVTNIIVCGHSNCGGCKALMKSKSEMSALPHTYEWLKLAHPVIDKVNECSQHDHDDKDRHIEQTNILVQLDKLLSYDFIREKVDLGNLSIYGLYYDIGEGNVYSYNWDSEIFEEIE